jgi:hypothetical protein
MFRDRRFAPTAGGSVEERAGVAGEADPAPVLAHPHLGDRHPEALLAVVAHHRVVGD